MKLSNYSKRNILQNLTTDYEVLFFDKIPSTNDYAKENITNFSKNTTIIAVEQTCGKGRFNRKFYSNKGGIYLTAVIKENLPLFCAPLITLFTAVAVSNALQEICQISCDIKWVNDLFIEGKKVCGILCESTINPQQKCVTDLVIGIGINVDNKLDKEIKSIATTLNNFNKKATDKSIIVAKILDNLSNIKREITKNDWLKEYKKRLFILGKKVLINEQLALVLDLNQDGSLLVEINGEKQNIYHGDVSIKI